MSWWRKLSDAFERLNDKYYKKVYNIKKSEPELEQEETLEEWKEKVENKLLKVRDSEINEPPYVTYFLKYCVYCHRYYPKECFSEKGAIYTDEVLKCSELRVNMKKLDERK